MMKTNLIIRNETVYDILPNEKILVGDLFVSELGTDEEIPAIIYEYRDEDIEYDPNLLNDFGYYKVVVNEKLTKNLKKRGITMSKAGAEQLWSEIENQGFGYWVLEYGYEENEDPILSELSRKAKLAMNELNEHIHLVWSKYDIG